MPKLEKVAGAKAVNKSGGVMGRQNKLPSTRAPQVKRRKFIAGGSNLTRFDPLDITGCQLWLKADAITGLSDGDDLTTGSNAWDDSSGEDNDSTSVIGNEPKWVESNSTINNKPSVRFTSTSKKYLTSTIGGDFFRDGGDDTDFTIFIVAVPTTVATNHQALFGAFGTSDWSSSVANTSNHFVMGIDEASSFSIHGQTPSTDRARDPSIDLVDDTAYILSTAFDFSAETVYMWQNGTRNDIETSFIRGGSAGTDQVIGSADSGTRGAKSNFYDGHIAEIIVYNTKLSEQNLWDVQQYLMTKYGFGRLPKPLYLL